MGYMVGIDVGGTFTDFSLFDSSKRLLLHYKTSSTPEDPSRAIIVGLEEMLDLYKVEPSSVDYLAHGTTVATNALIELKGARTALITTEGFKDLLEIARQTRPSLYDLTKDKKTPLVGGELRKEVRERILHDGSEYAPLDEAQTRAVAEELAVAKVDSVAICTLFSFVNPDHERRIAEIVKERMPGVYVSVSHKVVPEFREYQRMSTTVVNAYLGPVMDKYIRNFRDSVRKAGIVTDVYINQSNGSVISIGDTVDYPVRTAVSGPAAGVEASLFIARAAGVPNIITFDMGGTSADISLLEDYKALVSSEQSVHGYPVRIPMTDINTVGAGGGSIAWLDEGGALKVGPRSAGAQPGPACYMRGGKEPTVTDANVILGRLNQEKLLGGRMRIDASLSHKVVAERVCGRTGMSETEAALGIVSVVNSNMVRAVRVVSVERGYDPREFALVAFGGAGPLHACALAAELDMKEVIIPPSPGTLCSLGLLVADIKYDYVRTRILLAQESNLPTIASLFEELRVDGERFLDGQRIPAADREFHFKIDVRYQKQNYEISIPVEEGRFDAATMAKAVADFHKEHERSYGFANEGQAVQFVNYRLTAVGRIPSPDLAASKERRRSGRMEPIATRSAYFEEAGAYGPCSVYDRGTLAYEDRIEGPAIIEEMDATTVVPPQWVAVRDEFSNLRISRAGGTK